MKRITEETFERVIVSFRKTSAHDLRDVLIQWCPKSVFLFTPPLVIAEACLYGWRIFKLRFMIIAKRAGLR